MRTPPKGWNGFQQHFVFPPLLQPEASTDWTDQSGTSIHARWPRLVCKANLALDDLLYPLPTFLVTIDRVCLHGRFSWRRLYLEANKALEKPALTVGI
jgi:hypothetical protein